MQSLFLKWWILVTTIIFSSALIAHLGLWHSLYKADQTKLSFLILLVFIVSIIITGYVSKVNHVKIYLRVRTYLWYMNDAMITIGLIGTVAGFLMMLGPSFEQIDISKIHEVQKVISKMAVGMSTALTTTLVGLVCSLLLSLQITIIESTWDTDDT